MAELNPWTTTTHKVAQSSKGFCRKNVIFRSSKSEKFYQTFCHKSRFRQFSPSESEALSGVTVTVTVTVTAVNLFYEVLPKPFEAFGFYFSQEKKQVTAEYWVS